MRAVVVLIALVSPHAAIRGHSIDSRTNDNSRFRVRVDTGPLADDATPSLRYSGGTLGNASSSRDRTSTSLWFDVDRATAQILARGWGTPLHERAPLDADLRYTWRFPTEVTRGSPITVTIVATNTGTHTVGFAVGGRQRGPRDNRFEFQVTRDGVSLPIIVAPDFGGVMGYRALAPGDTVEVSADLRAWATLDRPGRYVVVATHETELTKDGTVQPGQADLWDIAPRGQGAIVVR
jgi:hypothetical protein